MTSFHTSVAGRLLAGWVFLCGGLHAEVRLLSGDANNALHNASATLLDISADGDRVLFRTGPPATGSSPGITASGLYIRRISANTLAFAGDASVADTGVLEASLSDDGRYISWSTTNGNIYWRDTRDAITRKITLNANGVSREPVISADGRHVAFVSLARNLIADATKLPAVDRSSVYVYDSQSATVSIATLAPNGAALNRGIGSAGIALNAFDFSADGRYVIYSTDADNAHPGRTEMTAGNRCVCRRNLATGEVLLLNRNASGTISDGNFTAPRISADGNRAAFFGDSVGGLSGAKMISTVPENFGSDLYVKDVASQAVWWGTKTTDNSAHAGVFSERPAIDADGNVVSFASNSTRLVAESTGTAGGPSAAKDVFRADLGAGGGVSISLVSKPASGSQNVDHLYGPVLPGTGDYVAFGTSQPQVMLGTTNPYSGNFQAVGVGVFPASGGVTFEQWAAALPEGSRGANAMPWADGVDNLTKYFTGMDPALADRARLPRVGTRTSSELGSGSGRYLTLEVRIRRDLPAGYTWTVAAAAHPAALASDSGSAIQVGTATPEGALDVYLYRFPTAINGDKGFMNVRFSKP